MDEQWQEIDYLEIGYQEKNEHQNRRMEQYTVSSLQEKENDDEVIKQEEKEKGGMMKKEEGEKRKTKMMGRGLEEGEEGLGSKLCRLCCPCC